MPPKILPISCEHGERDTQRDEEDRGLACSLDNKQLQAVVEQNPC